MHDAWPRRPVLALAGPTASGKTAVALAVAQALPIEVVSVDSALVYRGMDIGTAKPSADERQAVPHHLIDLIEPTETYSAARFVDDALAAITDIRARGREPLLVGGTMLYFKALTDGLDAMPAADPGVRAQLEADAERLGWPALHAQLSRLDPATAARLAPHDAQRIQRALEVVLTTGRPLSDWQQRDRDAADPERDARRQPVLLLSLEPRDRGWLHARITERLRAMAAAGFLDEVQRLRARGDLHAGLPSMRCVGYRQLWEALDDSSPAALAGWPERAIAATRQLAKRQLTWLRSLPERTVVDCDAPDARRLAVESLLHAQRRLAA